MSMDKVIKETLNARVRHIHPSPDEAWQRLAPAVQHLAPNSNVRPIQRVRTGRVFELAITGVVLAGIIGLAVYQNIHGYPYTVGGTDSPGGGTPSALDGSAASAAVPGVPPGTMLPDADRILDQAVTAIKRLDLSGAEPGYQGFRTHNPELIFNCQYSPGGGGQEVPLLACKFSEFVNTRTGHSLFWYDGTEWHAQLYPQAESDLAEERYQTFRAMGENCPVGCGGEFRAIRQSGTDLLVVVDLSGGSSHSNEEVHLLRQDGQLWRLLWVPVSEAFRFSTSPVRTHFPRITLPETGVDQFTVSYGDGLDDTWVRLGDEYVRMDRTDQILSKLREEAAYPIFVPTRVPAGWTARPPSVGDRSVSIVYLAEDLQVGLRVTNGPAGCCLDADSRKAVGETSIRGGITAYYIINQPEFGGPILWWQEAGSYIALSGPWLDKDGLVKIANSMSSTAEATSGTDDELAVSSLVTEFGSMLKAVSLQAPAGVRNKSMQDKYGDLVAPELLAEWQASSGTAPGRVVSSPWPERIDIMKLTQRADGAWEVQGVIVEVTSADRGGENSAKRPISLEVVRRDGRWVITAVTLGQYSSDKSIAYGNAELGFRFSLPEGWQGYTVVAEQWEGLPAGGSPDGGPSETGPLLRIRHPEWTAGKPRQDIPIMVFTRRQWEALQDGAFHVGAAPVGPAELGRNIEYVFALPARYDYAFLEGYEEVQDILASNPLRTIEPKPDR